MYEEKENIRGIMCDRWRFETKAPTGEAAEVIIWFMSESIGQLVNPVADLLIAATSEWLAEI